jgi:hypothetical protein
VFSETGATDEERVARNLVNHVASAAEVCPQLAPRAQSLEAEFQKIFDE